MKALARNTDPETSHEAADAMSTGRLEQMVVNILQHYPDGLTSEEISDKITHQTGAQASHSITPRFRPLADKGLIHEAGFRKNRSGRRAIVWKAAAFNQQVLF